VGHTIVAMSASATITFDEFLKVDVRVGRIVEARPFLEARKPAYQLEIDFGPQIGTRRASAQLTQRYEPAELVGRQVLAVVNFPPRQIASFFPRCWSWASPTRKATSCSSSRRPTCRSAADCSNSRDSLT
jgi:tRNA-binding protein